MRGCKPVRARTRMSYESVKSYVYEHRQSCIVVGLCVVIFGIGYGTGASWHAPNNKSSTPLSVKQNNYTTKPASLPPQTQAAEGEQVNGTPAATPEVKGEQTTKTPMQLTKTAAPTQASANCPVKGNVSKDSKIYHVPGGSFYNRVKPEQCFQTEAEATAAGFRKSTR